MNKLDFRNLHEVLGTLLVKGISFQQCGLKLNYYQLVYILNENKQLKIKNGGAG